MILDYSQLSVNRHAELYAAKHLGSKDALFCSRDSSRSTTRNDAVRAFVFAITLGAFVMSTIATTEAAPTTQTTIDRVEQMPNLPQPFKILNWRDIAIGYDKLVF